MSILTLLISTYLLQQAVVGCGLLYALHRAGEEFTKENVAMAAICMAFAPLTLIGLGGFIFHDLSETKTRKRVVIILNKWEHLAAEKSEMSSWSWFGGGLTEEAKHQHMREAVHLLKTEDLELLMAIGKSIHTIPKPVRDAVINELIDRKLLG